METWGLTGGIACGKSTVSTILRGHGAHVIDADLLAREVVAPGTDGLAALVDAFGTGILAEDGTLDRKALGARVFRDDAARSTLNGITHPRIAMLSAERMQQARASGARVVVYDAALLVENGLHRAMREVLLVAARPETQEARIVARDGLTPHQARERIASQLPLAEKRRVATVVFENDGTMEELRAQVDAFWHRVEPRLGRGTDG